MGSHRIGEVPSVAARRVLALRPRAGGWVPDEPIRWARDVGGLGPPGDDRGRPLGALATDDRESEELTGGVNGPVDGAVGGAVGGDVHGVVNGGSDSGGGADDRDDQVNDPEVEPPGERIMQRWRSGRWRRVRELWVPDLLRDARVDPGRKGTIVLSLIAAVAAVVAAVGVWRAQPEPRPISPITSAVTTIAAASAERSSATNGAGAVQPAAGAAANAHASGQRPSVAHPPSSSTPAVLAISVTGAVHQPGLIRVPAGARVADAIAAAGGATPEADITGLNLAAPLADGDSVVVAVADDARSVPAGLSRPMPSAGSAPAARGTVAVDLNTADAVALQELPGVGPVTAADIIAWRTAHGPFTSVEQLQEVTGIGPAKYARLSPLVVVG